LYIIDFHILAIVDWSNILHPRNLIALVFAHTKMEALKISCLYISERISWNNCYIYENSSTASGNGAIV